MLEKQKREFSITGRRTIKWILDGGTLWSFGRWGWMREIFLDRLA